MTAATRFLMTSEQGAICDCSHPRIIVEANAGAAKTTTAALKIARLVAGGANPSRIIALAFSEPGVQAYFEAFRRLGLAPEVVKALRVGTFEDFCAARLFRLENIRVERLARPEQVRACVLAAIARAREWAADRYPGEFCIEGSGELAVEGLLNEFSRLKGSMQLLRHGEDFQLSPACAGDLGLDFTTLAVYRFYEAQRCHSVDADGAQTRFRYFGDATYDLARLLVADDPSFSWEWHPLRLNLDAVILDEMHDTNWAMFTVLKELLAVNDAARFLGVGDRDQVIHGRHGADSCFMGAGFDTCIGPPQRLPLTESYRFGPEIAQLLSRFSNKAYPASRDRVSGLELKPTRSATDLLALIQEALTRRPGLSPAAPASQLAVLLRHPSAAVDLEHELRRSAIPYQTVGFTTYLERPEVLFVRLLLGAAVGLPDQFGAGILGPAKQATWEFIGGTVDGDAQGELTASVVACASQPNFAQFTLPSLLSRTDNAAARRQVPEAMRLAASDRIEDLPRALAALDIRTLARRVLVRTEAAEDAAASIQGLVRASQQQPPCASISGFLRSLLSHDYDAHAPRRADQRITLSSIEAAKGLEFEHVIVPDLNRSDFDGDAGDERNLFYVAASRARHRLTLTCRPGEASSYLRHCAAS